MDTSERGSDEKPIIRPIEEEMRRERQMDNYHRRSFPTRYNHGNGYHGDRMGRTSRWTRPKYQGYHMPQQENSSSFFLHDNREGEMGDRSMENNFEERRFERRLPDDWRVGRGRGRGRGFRRSYQYQRGFEEDRGYDKSDPSSVPSGGYYFEVCT